MAKKLPELDYDAGKSFYAWLKTIFLNCHRSRLRQRCSPAVDVGEHDRVADSNDQVADVEDAHYLVRQAFRLIEREFSPLHQKVFHAYVLEQRAPEEAAQELGIRPGTVYSVKSKILSCLRQELQQLLD